MRTSVYTDATDPDETDEWPGAAGNVDDEGNLVIVSHDTDRGGIETTYAPAEWASYETVATD